MGNTKIARIQQDPTQSSITPETQDQLTLEIPENSTCIVKIIDPLGKMVYEKPTNENNIQLNISELSMGIYLLYIERNNKRSAVFKFIKTN